MNCTVNCELYLYGSAGRIVWRGADSGHSAAAAASRREAVGAAGHAAPHPLFSDLGKFSSDGWGMVLSDPVTVTESVRMRPV